jgi:hypothetical protein
MAKSGFLPAWQDQDSQTFTQQLASPSEHWTRENAEAGISLQGFALTQNYIVEFCWSQ